MPEQISPELTAHQKKFSMCIKCPLGKNTLTKMKNVRVFYSGPIECDILIIGEAAGSSELATREPFTGKAGDLLRMMLVSAIGQSFFLPGISAPSEKHRPVVKIGFTNSVICPPCDSAGSKLRQPKAAEVKACADRLRNIVAIADAQHIVTAGKVAERAWKGLFKKDILPYHYICHPSAILRQQESGVIDIKRTKDTFNLIKESLRCQQRQIK